MCGIGNRLAAILKNNPCGCFPARSIPQAIALGQLLQHRLGLFQVERVEAFSEPAVDRREDVVGLGAPTLITPEPREACRGAKLKRLCLLRACDRKRLAERGLSR